MEEVRTVEHFFLFPHLQKIPQTFELSNQRTINDGSGKAY